MTLLPTTELEAVNIMLEGIGEAPVNALTLTSIPEVAIATSVLKNVARDFQAKGWHFNTEVDYPLALSSPDKFIYLPSNTMKVANIKKGTQTLDATQRGNRVYDKVNHTFVFDKGLTADLVLFLNFEELPQPARTYVTIKAARDFQKKIVGTETLATLTKEDEVYALFMVQEAESEEGDYSIFDSYDSARPIMRNHNPYGVTR